LRRFPSGIWWENLRETYRKSTNVLKIKNLISTAVLLFAGAKSLILNKAARAHSQQRPEIPFET
jgi:hypothetical protein